jgi:hypothetical protein
MTSFFSVRSSSVPVRPCCCRGNAGDYQADKVPVTPFRQGGFDRRELFRILWVRFRYREECFLELLYLTVNWLLPFVESLLCLLHLCIQIGEFPVYRLTVLLFGVRQFIAGSQVSELPLGDAPAELVFVGFEQVPVTSVIVTDADLSIITSPITSTSPSITTTVTTAIVTTATSLTIPVARRFAFQFFRHSFPPAPSEPEDLPCCFRFRS